MVTLKDTKQEREGKYFFLHSHFCTHEETERVGKWIAREISFMEIFFYFFLRGDQVTQIDEIHYIFLALMCAMLAVENYLQHFVTNS